MSGYVIVGFPNTKEGALHFEKVINGYMPEEELPESQYKTTRRNTEKVFPSPPQVEPPKKLVPSALTSLIFI